MRDLNNKNILLPHCGKMRLEAGYCPGFNLEHEWAGRSPGCIHGVSTGRKEAGTPGQGAACTESILPLKPRYQPLTTQVQSQCSYKVPETQAACPVFSRQGHSALYTLDAQPLFGDVVAETHLPFQGVSATSR